MCRPDWHIISRSAATLARWRPGSPRTSRRSPASPMRTGGRRCAHGRPPSWTRSPDVVPPHHGPQSQRRSSFSAHEKRRAPSLPSFEAVRAFSARARSFSLRLVSPRGALPLRCSPVSVSVSVSVCSEESRRFRRHFRIREGHDQTRGKNSGKQILTTFLEISRQDFDFRYVTFLSARDVLNVGFRRETFCFIGLIGFLGFFRFF